MIDTLIGKKCIASIALFGELVKKNMDVYATLAEFIKYFKEGYMFCSHSGVFQTAAVMLTGFLSVAKLNHALKL